jgi:predicted ABC-type ATPase
MSDAIDLHIEHVRALTRRGGPLDTKAPTASIQNPDWFEDGSALPARRALHRAYRDEALQVGRQELGRHAVVLAGAPGAGKSHLVGGELAPELAGHVVIDVDDIKQWLLVQASEDGSLEGFLTPPEVKELASAGERFFPLELSALVHVEAAAVAGGIRRRAVAQGLPLVVDGVLSDADAAVRLGRQLERAGYGVDVVCLDVAPEVSEHQIRHRWREAYEATLHGGKDLMGGRWVPSSFAQHVLEGPGGRSLPAVSAERLAHEVGAVNRYRVFTRTGVDAPTRLTTDLSRVRRDSPLIDSEAAAVYRTVRGPQRPHHRRGRGGAVEGGLER